MTEPEITINREDLEMLFDTVCHSMDFGSGFLDTPEVMALRRIAVVLGVDPMQATPYDYRKKIVHEFKPSDTKYNVGLCLWCGKKPDDSLHAEEAE